MTRAEGMARRRRNWFSGEIGMPAETTVLPTHTIMKTATKAVAAPGLRGQGPMSLTNDRPRALHVPTSANLPAHRVRDAASSRL